MNDFHDENHESKNELSPQMNNFDESHGNTVAVDANRIKLPSLGVNEEIERSQPSPSMNQDSLHPTRSQDSLHTTHSALTIISENKQSTDLSPLRAPHTDFALHSGKDEKTESRSIFGGNVSKKYGYQRTEDGNACLEQENDTFGANDSNHSDCSSEGLLSHSYCDNEHLSYLSDDQSRKIVPTSVALLPQAKEDNILIPARNSVVEGPSDQFPTMEVTIDSEELNDSKVYPPSLSPLTPQNKGRRLVNKASMHYSSSETSEEGDSPVFSNGFTHYSLKKEDESNYDPKVYERNEKFDSNSYQNIYSDYPAPPIEHPEPAVPTIHAQTFILSLAFLSVWSPQNLMAPNLTQMADFFHFTPSQRDLFLGANIAFATGVLSLPVSALIGFLADQVDSRKILFASIVFVGGITSICTGLSKTYTQLYFARFCCGSCMSGCVPIAFSLLGDLFDAKDRSAASSGLTAMMGAGILFGQVYAGYVGNSLGWQQPFLLSGVLSLVTSIMVLQFVREPIRGGKELVLQDMIAKGAKYSKTLSISGFLDAMTKNQTNVILMLQGFMTNIPWGIIFTFLNDYLSQEQALSVPQATYLLFWFGIGCAVGGVLGGYLGTLCLKINRILLPLFMALTTFLGIFPFLGLLDLDLRRSTFVSVLLAFSGGCIANLPSVNVRPCLLNVNPPETRGAAMTAANLMINVSRGAGPSLITMAKVIWGSSRQLSFNVLVSLI